MKKQSNHARMKPHFGSESDLNKNKTKQKLKLPQLIWLAFKAAHLFLPTNSHIEITDFHVSFCIRVPLQASDEEASSVYAIILTQFLLVRFNGFQTSNLVYTPHNLLKSYKLFQHTLCITTIERSILKQTFYSSSNRSIYCRKLSTVLFC